MSKIVDGLRLAARSAPESGIVEVITAARDVEHLIPLWVGEGDLPTPAFICEAAKRSLDDGETFYTYQRGIPELREALAGYHSGLYGRDFSSKRFFVTGSGMQAIQIAVQCVAGSGDEVIYPSPAWPNLAAAVEIIGAKAVPVAMDSTDSGWTLDIEKLFAAVTPRTKALFLNSPCNPTGWVAEESVLRNILDEARKRDLWIIADEVYGRFCYGAGGQAPSFYDFCDDEDKILFVNTFSKNWAMTGWRVGWISVPPVMGQVVENLIQYSTSGVPVFSQRAALAAMTEGRRFLDEQIKRAEYGRQIVLEGLGQDSRIHLSAPDGAFYLFFGVDGFEDSRQLALDLVRGAGVGLAPGSAFGKAGEGYLRLCYARSAAHLEEAVERIVGWLNAAK
ncbi:pyridoxal phosphate-dependent aminotransferase [Roseibium algae]|uniref:aspartate transaminase n=1 Tax=Roseibium algae TaxID=3123038 RepID=A0ABU8TGP1_9HYPH